MINDLEVPQCMQVFKRSYVNQRRYSTDKIFLNLAANIWHTGAQATVNSQRLTIDVRGLICV